VNALCLALMDAGISMHDMICSCSVGYIRKEFCVDVTQTEQSTGGAFLPMVVRSRSDDVVFMQMDCRLSEVHLSDAMSAGLAGCKKVLAYLEAAITAAKAAHV
jgi:ribonuclease PH